MKLINRPAGYLGVYYHSEPGVSRLEEWWVRAVDAPVRGRPGGPYHDKVRAMLFRPGRCGSAQLCEMRFLTLVICSGRCGSAQGDVVPPSYVR